VREERDAGTETFQTAFEERSSSFLATTLHFACLNGFHLSWFQYAHTLSFSTIRSAVAEAKSTISKDQKATSRHPQHPEEHTVQAHCANKYFNDRPIHKNYSESNCIVAQYSKNNKANPTKKNSIESIESQTC
jgi:hypothetical protein